MDKSSSGSACPYYYKGGELHPLKYGGCHDDAEKLLAVMGAEEAFILKSPGRRNRRIWIDLYETRLTPEVMDALTRHIGTIEEKIYKLCLVGCRRGDRRRIIGSMNRLGLAIAGQIRFFDDPELAKDWLVGEGR